jgi:hypothetical protein
MLLPAMLNKSETIKPIHLKKGFFFNASVIYLTLVLFYVSGDPQFYSVC